MAQFGNFTDIGVDISDYIATIEIRKPPNNFFDVSLIGQIADAFERLDKEDGCRVILLCAQGKHFCVGNDFSKPAADVTRHDGHKNPLYAMGVRLFQSVK